MSGLMLSGDLGAILDATRWRVTADHGVGKAKDVDTPRRPHHRCGGHLPGTRADRQPCPPVFGDWTPRQNQFQL